MNYATGLRCVNCGASYPLGAMFEGCPKCRTDTSVSCLTVTYDYERLHDRVSKRYFAKKWQGMSSFSELLPIQGRVISLGEGGTPLAKCQRLAEKYGVNELYVKDESRNPTWSFKDRLCSVSVSHALNLGAKTTTVSSSGNHGAATAAYSAKAGLECVIFTMGFAPKTFLTLMQIYGAKVVPVTTSEGRWMLMSRCVRELGWYPTGSYSLPSFTGNPYGLEGYKTIAYEIAVQLRWQVPDYILVPVGGGEGLYGIWKGFKELQQFGLIDNLPKMVSVETACGGPLKNAFDKKLDHIERVQAKPTVAFSIGTATTGLHALNAVKESLGHAITVTDEEIMEAQKYLAALEGVYCEPSSAASVAGMAKMTEQGSLDRQTVKVCVITSSGLKDPESTAKVLKRLPSTEPEWSRFKSLMKEVYQFDVSI